MSKTLRLILGDQLNSNHSWYQTKDNSVTYVLMEIRSETDYATHHIQKIAGFFSAM
jgi:deoxyribodipyrimidine photolyase-related protein